jgi:hypothetical protein
MTELGFLQPSRIPRPANTALKILGWLYPSRDLQEVLLFCLLGLVILTGLMKYFANLGAIVAKYNQL